MAQRAHCPDRRWHRDGSLAGGVAAGKLAAKDRDPELLVSSAGALRFRPVGKGRVVYLARDGLRLFDSATSQTTALRIAGCSPGTIRVLTAARPSGFWIAGERGVGRVSWPPDDDSVPCVPQGGDAAHRLSRFSNLFDDGDGVQHRQGVGGQDIAGSLHVWLCFIQAI